MSVRHPDPAHLATTLHSAAIHLLRRLRKQDELSGLSAARMSALSVLVFGGPRTIGDLAIMEQVAAPTMTRLVTGMEADKLVVRRPDANDGRVTWLHATKRGERILREGQRRRVEALTRALTPATDAELQTLARALDTIAQATARLAEDTSA